MTIRHQWKVLAAATALVASPVLAACGSDDEGGSSDSGASSGDPIKVMVYGPFDAKGFSLPNVKTGAQAGVDKVNEEGGIGGRELELIACNDNNDPNAAAGCARQAVQEGVLAVVGGFSTFEPQLLPTLADAGIPVVGFTAVSSFSAPLTYAVAGGAPAGLFALAKDFAANPECGGKVGSVIEDFAAAQGAIKLFQLAAEVSGATDTGVSSAPQGATDFAPAVAAASDKAQCLAHIAGPQTSPVIIKAIADNGTIKAFGSSESTVPTTVIEALGDVADGETVFSSYLPLNDSTDTPEMKEFLERGRAIDKEFSPEQISASAYLASIILQQALDGVDAEDLTSKDIVTALDGFSGFESGIGPVVDFTKKNPTKGFSTLPYDAPVYKWIAKGGAYVLADKEPITVADIYDAASAAGQ